MSNHTPVRPRGYVYRAEAARILGVGVSTLYRLIRAGELQTYYTAGRWPCYKITELHALYAARTRVRKG